MPQRRLEPLDVLKLNEEWVQYRGGTAFIRLKDRTELQLDLGDYELIRVFGTSVGNLPLRYPGEAISEEEIENILWDRLGADPRAVKLQVTVFGIYRKR